MKGIFRYFGIAAAVAVIGLLATGCPTRADDNGDRSGHLGPTLSLQGQVWTEDRNRDTGQITRERFQGTREIDSGLGGSGAVTGGQLNFTIGTPSYLRNLGDRSLFGDDETISDPDAMAAILYGFETPNGWLDRVWFPDIPQSGRWVEIEIVAYVYVDRDVTVSVPGGEWTDYDNGFTYIDIEEAVTLFLQAGWNIVYFREAHIVTETSHTLIGSIGIGEPNYPVRWVLSEWDDYSRINTPSPRSRR